MKSIDWEKIQLLFNQAIDLDEEDRLKFLKTECGDDEELYSEVITLLEADESIHPVLNKKASEIVNIEEKLNFVGQEIGSYKIIEEIASGGMGTVFLAERSDGFFDQKVALKIVKPGLSTIPIIRRFQHERQILANLHHPNIARLYDGGVTDDRRPFFTMEYVDGIPIDEYCDKKKLTVPERLKLFIKVCETVQYAHNNLVIHRDLKPNNILIQKDGTLKLLDFGISKVLSAENDNSDLPTITQAEINLLTPEYSSPEQIKNSSISVSTDVYSLGLILYKLLTGKSAHEFKTNSFVEYEKVVCEKSIPKPSTVFMKSNGDEDSKLINDITKNRKTQLKKLKRTINGDLDNICLMALRKEPERRYVSAEMLAYDIERYLTSLPILARKESFVYTAGKFVIRHKLAVITAVALFFIVNGLILYYTIQLRQERDNAQREARKSEQVASFMKDLFLVSDPNESYGETITAMELLDKGAAKLKGGLKDEPEIKSQLLNTIGVVYTNLGLYNSAEEIFSEIKNNQEIESLDKVTYLETIINLGRLYRLDGKYTLAKEVLEMALEKAVFNLEKDHPLIGDCYLNLGGYLYETGDYEKADEYLEIAKTSFIKNFGYTHEKVAATLHNLGVLSFELRNLEKADSLYTEAINIEVELNGEINSNVAEYQNQLAQVLRHQEKYDEAKLLYEKVLNTRNKLFGGGHPSIAVTLNHLSRLYYNQAMYEEAEPIAREALKMRLKYFDPDHPEVSASRSSLGGILFHQKKYDEAEKYYRSAYISSLNKLGTEHPYTPAIEGNLGRTLMENGEYEKAEEHLSNSLKMIKRIFSNKNRYVTARKNWLSELYLLTGRYKEAENLLQTHIDSLENNPSESKWIIGQTKSLLGYALFKLDKDIEAEGYLVHSFNLLKKEKGFNSFETQKALQRVIEFYKSKGRDDKVLEYSSQT